MSSPIGQTPAKAMLSFKLRHAQSLLTNYTQARELHYITESADWAILNVGRALASNLAKANQLSTRITTSPVGIKSSILHFGSRPTAFHNNQLRHWHPSNKAILTMYHLPTQSEKIAALKANHNRFDLIHTASQFTKNQLLNIGIPEQKIHIIPLGIDLGLFKLTGSLPAREKFVIGSFQKDGVGWKEGSQPKLEKGPDVFIEVVKKVNQTIPVHVILTGPARGYVEKRLADENISFASTGYLPNAQDVIPYYKQLDCYLMTSRIEGGPLSLLESWASGVPFVGTKVGLVPDITTHQHNALLSDSEDVDTLAQNILVLANDQKLGTKLTTAGRQTVQDYNWPKIAQEYYQQLYQPLRT